MKLSQFTLSQLVFEVRYDDAFEIWDCAGEVHRALTRLWPTVRLVESGPNKQSLRSEAVQIQTGLKSSSVMLFAPSSVLQRADAISETFKIWAQALRLGTLERVGTRSMFRRVYESEGAAGAAALSLMPSALPNRAFGHEEMPVGLEFKLTWKSRAVGTNFGVRTELQTFEIEAAPEFSEYRKKGEKHFLVVDLDRFTLKPLQIEQFRTHDWLTGIHRLITRDLTRLVNPSETNSQD